MTLEVIAIAAGSYLIGSIPTGVLLARQANVDIQAEGSGNIGATNVTRTAGWKLGLLTFLLDALKGAVPVLLANSISLAAETSLAAALGAVLGHIFPPALGFRGGKGVATAAGAMLALAPGALLLPLVLFAFLVLLTRQVSLGSIVAALMCPVGAMLAGYPQSTQAVLALIAALIVWRHRDNVGRLRAGTEDRL